MNEIEEVYVVTSGEYSSYMIDAVFLTLPEAQAFASEDPEREVEIWPIGTENNRNRGTAEVGGEFRAQTGEVCNESEDPRIWPTLQEEPGYSIRYIAPFTIYDKSHGDVFVLHVYADTLDRARKVYSEKKAQLLTDISLGLPPEAITTKGDSERAS